MIQHEQSYNFQYLLHLFEELILFSEIATNSGKLGSCIKRGSILHLFFGSDFVLKCNIPNSSFFLVFMLSAS